MDNRGLAAFCLLAAILFCVPCVSAQTHPMMESPDWRFAYAQSHTEEELAAVGVRINGNDISFARMKVAAAEKDCANMGGVWCDWAKEDREALQRMLRVQAGQANTPLPGSGPGGDPVDIVSSALNQLESIWSTLEGLMRNLFGY